MVSHFEVSGSVKNKLGVSCVYGALIALAVLMCALGAAGQADSDKASQPARVAAKRMQLQGVGNFLEVTPTLYRGAQPTHKGFESLVKMGIDIVVDVRGSERPGEGREVNRLGMKYVSIPWRCPFPRDEVFAQFLKMMQENPGKKVFVHCRLGDDRTGMMIASYRMAAEGWSADEAMREMETSGFAWSHHVICPGLASYEKHFPEHLRKNPVFDGLGPWEPRDKLK